MVVEAPPRQHYNVTLAILILAGTAFALQQTMIIPALPVLRDEFGTTQEWATWLLTGFLLSASVSIPIVGKLGDQYGKERLLVISLSVFLLGSVVATLAPNIGVLIACRILQGVGGAIFPLSFAIIKDEFPAEKVGVAVGAVSAVFSVGGSLGLVLSGVIVDQLSWRWLFIVGAIGVAAAVGLVHVFVPESPIKTPSRVDVPGAALLSAGLLALLLALTEGERWGWGSTPIVSLFAASGLLLAVWGWVETRVPEPMVDMRMLARRSVLFANATALIAGFALFGTFILVPALLQLPTELAGHGFGVSATRTGLYLVPGTVFGFVTGPLAGVMGNRFGAKWPLSLGMALGATGLTLLALWHDTQLQIVLWMVVLGAGLPMTFAAMAKIIVDAVRLSETGVATGMNTVMRTIGGVIGGQSIAALLAADTLANGVPAESAFVTAFSVGAGSAFVGALIALLITPRRRLTA